MIGKDDPSTVEYLKYDDRVARSNGDSQMPKIDEECSSISSQTDFITNEEMLIRVNGSEKIRRKISNLDNGYYSDTSMSPKKGVTIASTSDTKHSHSNPSGDYIQSSESPYVDDSIALQQHNMSPLSDPNESYSSLSQLQTSEDPQTTPISNNDNLGEYVADSMEMERYNSSVDVAPADLGYVDHNTAVNQHTTKQVVPYSPDADMDMKIDKDSNSFPYVAVNEDPITSMPSINKLGSSYNAHSDTKEKDHNSDLLSYLQNVTVADSQDIDGIYVDHSFPVQQSNTAEQTINTAEQTVNTAKQTINTAEQAIDTTEQTLLHETNSASSISHEYTQENDDGGYISELI